ncbi:TPA: hypothetical protein DCX66_03565 [Candidatus Nomurabacteria bacterium]|uniref:VTT domain-containing protein n=1 Tax=Candidatus Nomurabacteria bacterium GW2011_GWE1_35_16 TaxID=1618761 RepID=A0A0G0EI01_9BACT|nr:MAG: hypothetical protein UR55_C0001G0036 [Candidatus Nomurabacteria bacterium GW2011_GWF1_34_20]KKP63745.1 MAG: hypothetical protein UR57_C0001G0036 [Candidatus Nomurabacteria bacterium GW2011_GWE2_34_25]KKP66957.1 MAG: hypothetical protein UR64_C0001G0036 [Candidatus Nomurabacteria bacterium GW2011_GWE1_35_16]HAE36780.1 hypothetical protein [Candidatus Nomurabacteria bacterium]HAX65517.1 hypothetical protein [Candidatus Nomurabacteria bacterium]
MDILTELILPYIILYKYWALFVVTFFSALFIPIPAGTLLIASSAFASQGYFKISTLLIIVIIANIAGDNLSYLLAKLYGKKVFSHIPFINKVLNSKDFILVEKGISKKSGFIIILSRFEVISTITLNIICGISKIKYKKFLTYEIIGTFANVLFYSSVGYFFGDNWQAINKLIGNFSIIFFIMIIITISFFWGKMMHKLKSELQN